MVNENDFKYVVQDISSVQLGARFKYGELMKNDRVPFKFQSVIRIYIYKEKTPDTEIGQHIISLKEEDLCYEIFKQLRIKIKFYEPKKGDGFTEKVMKIADFVPYAREHWTEESMIHEVILSSLALMTFAI